MTRIAEGTSDREVLKRALGKIPKCEDCNREATIWIRRGQHDDLFLCDVHAFHLARILMQDIGHAFEYEYELRKIR